METSLWRLIDEQWLKQAIRNFLTEAGGDVLPTDANVRRVLDSGLRCAALGDPCIVAVQGGDLLGFLYWYGSTAFDSPMKTLYADGSYVLPAHRHKRVGTYLRLEGQRIARESGYTRIVYSLRPDNIKGIEKYIKDYDARPCMILMEQHLKD